MNSLEISVVLPVYDEEKTLNELNARLTKTLLELRSNYEIIYVNDNSQDGSLEKLKNFYRADKNIKIIDLSRNFGHLPALIAGIESASGNCVIIMDADLQDSPEAIKDFYAKWKEGYEVVYAIRAKRQESLFSRIAFKAFYWILFHVSNITQPIDAGIFSLLDRKVVNVFKTLREKNRYIPGLRSYIGFKQIGLKLDRLPRKEGKSKVGTQGLFRLAFDAIFSFSYLPLRIAIIGGSVVAIISFILMGYFAILRILIYFNLIELKHFTPGFTFIICSIYLLSGIILICLGIMGEYIGRIYDEVKDRPYYVVREKIGF